MSPIDNAGLFVISFTRWSLFVTVVCREGSQNQNPVCGHTEVGVIEMTEIAFAKSEQKPRYKAYLNCGEFW